MTNEKLENYEKLIAQIQDRYDYDDAIDLMDVITSIFGYKENVLDYVNYYLTGYRYYDQLKDLDEECQKSKKVWALKRHTRLEMFDPVLKKLGIVMIPSLFTNEIFQKILSPPCHRRTHLFNRIRLKLKNFFLTACVFF